MLILTRRQGVFFVKKGMEMGKSFYLNLIICFSLSIFFVGCLVTPPLQTPSGRPEVTLYGITKKQFFDNVAGTAMVGGYEIREVNDYNMVLAKRNTSFGAAVLFGSRYNTTPEERITLTVIEVPRGIRIFATCTIVTNPGSAFEKVTTSSNFRGIQAELEKMKANYGTENRQEQIPTLETDSVSSPVIAEMKKCKKESCEAKNYHLGYCSTHCLEMYFGKCRIAGCQRGKYTDGKCYKHRFEIIKK